jgi:hypothetical protein
MTENELEQIKHPWVRDVMSRSAYDMEQLKDIMYEQECDLQEAASVAAQALTPGR